MRRPAWARRVWAGDAPRERLLLAGVLAAMLALTLIAWWPAHDGWFLLDDYRWLPPPKRRFDVLKSLVGPWGHAFAYRPLVRLSFFADLQVFGLDPRGWHLHSFLLHAINGTLLFSLIRATTDLWAPALAIAALFIVSPLTHENVAWISGRTFLLGGAFFLLSANLIARAFMTAPSDARREATFFRWGAVSFVAAMASYEPAVVLPFLVIAAVWLFPSIVTMPRDVVRHRIRQLLLILVVFLACRFVFLMGHLGAVNPTSPYWMFEPIRWWLNVWIRSGNTLRIASIVAVAVAFVGSFAILWLRPTIAPRAARHLHAFLIVAAFVLFLPFINVIGIADRFLYLVQTIYIATIVLLLWLIARLSRIGATMAVTIVLLLSIAGIVECRRAARDWAGAGTIARAVADSLKAKYPVWPAHTDVVLDRVPRSVGRAPIYVLYTKESVLQRYSALEDTRVIFGEELAATRTVAHDARPAKYFRFDARSLTLSELSAAEWEQAHAAVSSR
jgi:hypothetical protein